MDHTPEPPGDPAAPALDAAGAEQPRVADPAPRTLEQLSNGVWAFAALASALEAGLLDALIAPCGPADLSARTGLPAGLVAGLLDVLAALDLVERVRDGYQLAPVLQPRLQTQARPVLLADLRTVYLQSDRLIRAAARHTLAPGWEYTDPELLAAQGQGSTGEPAVQHWAAAVFPRLEGLLERLQRPGAAFLDVGTGVGAIALAMGRRFPALHVVGLEPQPAALAEARRNVAAAGLADRLTLRAQRVEDLPDQEAFDLVWLPQMFLPQSVLQQGLRQTWAALRPGGWILLLAVSTPGLALDAAIWRLRNILWGGDPLYPEQVAALVAAAGFTRVQVLPTHAGAIPKLIAGQRPAAPPASTAAAGT